MISNLQNFINRPIPFIHQQWKIKGDFFPIRIAHQKFYFAYHPKYVKHFLCDKADHYQKSRMIFDKIIPVTGKKGLVQLENDEWNEARKKTDALFYKKQLEDYIPIFDRNISYVKKSISESSDNPICLKRLIDHCTLNTILSIFTGDMQQNEVGIISDAFVKLNAICGKKLRSVIDFPSWFPTAENRMLCENKVVIDEIIKALMKKKEVHSTSFLGMLSADSTLTFERIDWICDQLRTFLFAGYETTAASLFFTCFLLSKNPDIQEQAYLESCQLFSSDAPVDVAAIRQLKYITAIYRESLRLYPPAWILAREAVENDCVNGNTIQKGDQILIQVRAIHRHPDIWKNPHQFNPDRFYRQKESPEKIDKFAFIPFGVGSRICSGTPLAMLEAVYFIARFINQYQLTLNNDERLLVEPMITLHPKKIPTFQIQER